MVSIAVRVDEMPKQIKPVPDADAGNDYVVGPVSPPPVPSGGRPLPNPYADLAGAICDEKMGPCLTRHVPEFLRLPPAGQACPFTSLRRSYLNSLILPTPENGHKPPVRSFVLRQRGKQTGVRLIDYASLSAFIRRHAETGEPADGQGARRQP